ncbi:MAG: ribosomal protein methylthiotransferase accessory factor [Solirubrobacteraceae bacterium]|nr:ribosomal protein methylthiotransferase accessory factor [Solirubrobacteraceae bacterium]
MARYCGRVEVFHPFPACPEIVFGRAGARSSAFGPTEASGGAPVVVGSAAGCNEVDVALRSRNELVERVSNILAGRLAERSSRTIKTFATLRREGTAALDPAAWRPSIPGIRDAPMLWVTGRSLVDGRETLVPAGASFLRHQPPPGCPVTLRAGSAGVAAHATAPLAARHALLELLERDLVARSWYATGPVRAMAAPPWPAPLGPALDALGMQATTLLLDGPSRSACLVTCLHTAKRERQSFGARCVDDRAADLHAGFERAAYEALMVHWSMGTPVAQRAWRDMRQRPAPARPRNAVEHALWTFHEQDSLGHWLAKANTTGPADVRHALGQQLAATVAEYTGEDVVAVDSTMADADAEVVVVRVVAPGAERLPITARDGELPHPFG